MEAATPLRQAHVAVLANRLVIDGLAVTDACAVQVVRERVDAGEDPAKVVSDAIEIGARVLDREHAGATVEVLRADLERATEEAGRRTDDVAKALTAKVDELVAPDAGQVTKVLARHFSDESSAAVQHRIRRAVEEVLTDSREKLLKQFSSADDSNPLADFKAAQVRQLRALASQQDTNLTRLNEQMVALQLEIQKLQAEKEKAEEVAAEFDKSSAKGRPYEEAVFDAIDAIARGQGDDADAVGDESGAGGKKGDVVVAVDGANGPARTRIVFEAKNSNPPSKKSACEYLEEAMRTRDAAYGVWVVPAEDKLPSKFPSLREVGGDKVFAVYDPEDGSTLELEVAYKLARFRALAAGSSDAALDPGALRGEIEKTLQCVDNCRRIKTQLTKAGDGVSEARSILEAMEADVRAQLTRIGTLLAAADDAA